MEFFRGKRERSVLNRGGADIKWNSPLHKALHAPFAVVSNYISLAQTT